MLLLKSDRRATNPGLVAVLVPLRVCLKRSTVGPFVVPLRDWYLAKKYDRNYSTDFNFWLTDTEKGVILASLPFEDKTDLCA